MDWIFEQIKSFLWLFVVAVKKASRIISLLSCLAKLLGKWQTAFVMRVRFIYMPYRVHFGVIQCHVHCISFPAGLWVACDSHYLEVLEFNSGSSKWIDDHSFHRYKHNICYLSRMKSFESLYNLGFDGVCNWYKQEEGLYK